MKLNRAMGVALAAAVLALSMAGCSGSASSTTASSAASSEAASSEAASSVAASGSASSGMPVFRWKPTAGRSRENSVHLTHDHIRPVEPTPLSRALHRAVRVRRAFRTPVGLAAALP